MHMHHLLVLGLLCAGISSAEYIPPNHILWGEKGPPGATLLPQARVIRSISESLPLEERDTACVNSPVTRSCWAGGYSIATDFDAKWPPAGRTVSASSGMYQGQHLMLIAVFIV